MTRQALTDATYPEALTRIEHLWRAGANKAEHPDHTEFDRLYHEITAYEEDAGIAAAPRTDFQLSTLEHLEWYVGKKADLASKISRIKAQAAAMIRDLEREEERLDWRYAEQAEAVLRTQLATRRGKSLKLLTGTVGVRKVAGRVTVLDDAALQDAIRTQAPHLQEAITTRVDPKRLSQLVKVIGDTAYRPDAGEAQDLLPGLGIVPERETFYVKSAADTSTD